MRMSSFFLLAVLAGVAPAISVAQSPSHSTSPFLPLSAGGSVMLGLEGGDAKQNSAVVAAEFGAYVESLHYRFHPGLEVRGEAGGGVLGTLTGPRVSYWFLGGEVAVYIAALFGPQHSPSTNDGSSTQFVTHDAEGITSKGVVGVDLYPINHPHTGLRVEYSQGIFTGLPNARPKTVLAGLILRFP